MKKEDEMKRTYEENWKKIDPVIKFLQPSVRTRGLCYPVSYKDIKIARLYCSGQVEFINKENWKKGWEFKFERGEDDQFFFYRYVGK